MSTPPDEEDAPSTDGASSENRSITTAVSPASRKVVGETDASDAAGVVGRATDDSSATYGVVGEIESIHEAAAGVVGNATGPNHGVLGQVYDDASELPGPAIDPESAGVMGTSDKQEGFGVVGWSTNYNGLLGRTDSQQFAAGLFYNTAGGPAIEANGHLDVSKVGASAYLSTAQTINDNVSTTVAFDDFVADDRAEFDTSTGEFTCASAGDYHVSTTVNWGRSLPAGTIHEINIVVDSTTVARRFQTTQNDTDSGILTEHLCKTLKGLESGDVISIEVRQTRGGSVDLETGRENTYVTIDKVG